MALAAAFMLGACGDADAKTVSWEEETRLNSGEVVWVKRTDSFSRRAEPGNPLASGWWPEARRYEFTWRGRQYAYETNPKESLGAIVLAVRGQQLILLDRSRACRTPGFAEFVFDGSRWQLQKSVGSDMLGQARNLMYSNANIQDGQRLSADDKLARDKAIGGRAAPPMTVDISNIAAHC
jgi:hypothetical protein